MRVEFPPPNSVVSVARLHSLSSTMFRGVGFSAPELDDFTGGGAARWTSTRSSTPPSLCSQPSIGVSLGTWRHTALMSVSDDANRSILCASAAKRASSFRVDSTPPSPANATGESALTFAACSSVRRGNRSTVQLPAPARSAPAAMNGAYWSTNRDASSPPSNAYDFEEPSEDEPAPSLKDEEAPSLPPPPSAWPVGSKTHRRPADTAKTASVTWHAVTSPLPNLTTRRRSLNGAAAERSCAISSGCKLAPVILTVTAGPWKSASCGRSSDVAGYVRVSSATSISRAPTASAISTTSARKNAESLYIGSSLRSVSSLGHGSRSVDPLSTANMSRSDLAPNTSAASCETDGWTRRHVPRAPSASQSASLLTSAAAGVMTPP